MPRFLFILTTSLNLQENVPLAPLTTLKVGGPAKYFVRAESEEAVIAAFEFANQKDLDVFVLGGGSNILVSDRGFGGLVIQVALKGISVDLIEPGMPDVTARAGEDWDRFVEYCVSRDLGGVECLSGIPGFVGGTPVQNVGAYGQEVSESIVSVRCFDRRTYRIVELSNEECRFTYRASIFNAAERDRYVVLAVTYRLTANAKPKIAYKDVKEFFSGKDPSLRETREAILHIRRSKSMVIDPDDPNRMSAGSFFKNPVVPNEKYDEIAARRSESVPKFNVDGTSVKIPAAWLIEQSGFKKGYRLGNSGISTRHTLAIINCGGATAPDVVALKDAIQSGVERTFGILLQPEPVFVGF